jgi:hypothetical protein
MPNAIAEKVDNFFRETSSMGFYIVAYPFLKWYFNTEADKHAKQLVKITETPREVLKEPITIEPSIKYPSMETRLQFPRELFEKRDRNKRRVYVNFLSLGTDEIIEEISHEIRDRIHDDKDAEVSEFFGMVGRILIKGSEMRHNIPTVEKLANWREKTNVKLEQINKTMERYKDEIMHGNKETLTKRAKEVKMPKELIEHLESLPNDTDNMSKGIYARMLTDAKYFLEKTSLEIDLKHAIGYEAAVRNKEAIEQNPKGIYLLSTDEVRQRFFN